MKSTIKEMSLEQRIKILEDFNARQEEVLSDTYKEFAEWEKQLVYDYGNRKGEEVLENLPVDELISGAQMWMRVAQAKQASILIKQDLEKTVQEWRSKMNDDLYLYLATVQIPRILW